MDATTAFFIIFFTMAFFILKSGGRPLTDEEKEQFEKDNSVVNDSSTGNYIK